MAIDAALLHRYAVAVPDRVQLEIEEKWYQVAQVAIVIGVTVLSTFALAYSAFVLESSIIGVSSIVVILAGATQLWEYCNEWLRKNRKAIEIVIIFEGLLPQQFDNAVHRILSARVLYFQRAFDTFDRNINDLLAKKKEYRNGVGLDFNTHEYTQKIFDFNAQIYEQKKSAAIARIKIAWLNVLIEQPDFQGELADLCYYCENEKYEEHCIDLQLVKEVDFADCFLFKNDEDPLQLDEVLTTDPETLRYKLYKESATSDASEQAHLSDSDEGSSSGESQPGKT